MTGKNAKKRVLGRRGGKRLGRFLFPAKKESARSKGEKPSVNPIWPTDKGDEGEENLLRRGVYTDGHFRLKTRGRPEEQKEHWIFQNKIAKKEGGKEENEQTGKKDE